MERLTDSGRQYHSCDFMEDGIYIFINRLRKYEDTGLTPPEIMELKMKDTAESITVEEFHGVKVYSCPICNEPVHEKDNFCSKCGQRLKQED